MNNIVKYAVVIMSLFAVVATSQSVASPAVSSSHAFSALIGSVLNGATLNKSLQTSSFAYPNSYPVSYYNPKTSTGTQPSPYSTVGFVPTSNLPNAASNGGGVSYFTFTNTGYDNILRVTQLSTLASNAGPHSEYESLWLTGFPVYDQHINSFAVLSAGGAYEAIFANAIPASAKNIRVSLMGTTWTITSAIAPSANANNTTAVSGGKITLKSGSNTLTLTDGTALAGSPGWVSKLLWTNSIAGKANELYGIILYNTTPVSALLPGQSFNFTNIGFVQHSMTFIGDSLGPAKFDHVSVSTSALSALSYQNVGASVITNITEPAQLLTVTSSIPNAFSFAGKLANTVVFDLTPYQLANTSNATGITGYSTYLILNVKNSAFVTSTNPLTVTITGYTSSAATAPVTQTVTYTTVTGTNTKLTTPLFNVTSIRLSRSLTGVQANVTDISASTAVTLGLLQSTNAGVVYPLAGKTYDGFTQSGGNTYNVTYDQYNGQPTQQFQLMQNLAPATGTGINEYFSFQMSEMAIPSNTSTGASLSFSIYNSTAGLSANPFFNLNYSGTGVPNNITYTSTQARSVNAQVGFRTERGSEVTGISATSDSFNFAKAIDALKFMVK